jgi:hypothetical protein
MKFQGRITNVLGVSCFLAVTAFGVLVACAGAGGTSSTMGCGSPPPTSPPQLWLVYPMPSATAISDSIGNLIFADVGAGAQGTSIGLSTSGVSVTVGAYTAAPSPLPSPRVTPGPKFGANAPYVAVPIPTLSAASTYTVTFTYPAWADNPPSCTTTETQTLGNFTTQ